MSTATVTIDQPGLYPDVSHEDYHADPVLGGSLSSSEAKLLIPPSCPAKYRWHKDHGGRRATRAMDLGSAAHLQLLGTGPALVVIDAPDYRKKAAQTAKAEAQAAGAVPLLAHEHATVEAMAHAIRRHPVAGPLFAPGTGTPEQTIVWQDEISGVWCRCRVDWLRQSRPGRRLIVPDFKTCATADPNELRPTFARLGYHQSAAHYLDGIRAIGYDPDPVFLFVCQEREPPYLVTVVELDATALRIGAARNAWARSIYADCTTRDHWPPYVEGVEQLSLPRWVEIEEGAHVQ